VKNLPPVSGYGPRGGKISQAGEAFVEDVVQLGDAVLKDAPPPVAPAYDAPPGPRRVREVRRAVNAFYFLAVGLSLLLAATLFLNKTSLNGVGGVCFFVEPTDAMKPLVPRGSLLVTVYRRPADIEPGDIITYYAMRGEPDTRLTRIVDERLEGDGGGNILFRTKRAPDAPPDSILTNTTLVRGVKLLALPGAGYIISFVQSYALGLAVLAVALCVSAELLRRWLRGKGFDARMRVKRRKGR
jgi:hypothetical protein